MGEALVESDLFRTKKSYGIGDTHFPVPNPPVRTNLQSDFHAVKVYISFNLFGA